MTSNSRKSKRPLTLSVLVFSALALLSFSFFTPVRAASAMTCTCDMTNAVASLPQCVTMHWQAGDINNKGVYNALESQAQNAKSLAGQGDKSDAIGVLYDFIGTVQDNNGTHITMSAADMLVMHAQIAITQLGG